MLFRYWKWQMSGRGEFSPVFESVSCLRKKGFITASLGQVLTFFPARILKDFLCTHNFQRGFYEHL